MRFSANCGLLAGIIVLAFNVHSASANTLHVGTCALKGTVYGSIQSAVDAAAPGDVIAVCPGDYAEQVKITKSLTVKGVAGGQPVRITVPAGGLVQNTTTLHSGFPTAAQVLVSPDTTADVIFKGIVVDGTGNNITTCGLQLAGIYYRNAGGTIIGSTAQNQILPDGYQGCQSGLGIFVENQASGTDSVNIEKNTVTNFDKNGITVELAAAAANITHNTVTGIGPTTLIAQNGIEVSYGATASITANTISDLIYSPDTYGSSGIILYQLDSAEYQTPTLVQGNTIDNAQYGVVLDAVNGTADNLVQIHKNTITNAQFAGVGLYSDGISDDYISVTANKIDTTTIYDGIDACSDNNTITGNTVSNSSAEAAIHLDALCTQPDNSPSGSGNTVSSNKILTACVGILSGPPQGANTIGANKFTNVTNTFIYGTDSYSCGDNRAQVRHTPKKGHSGAPAALAPLRR
ncbi:MAG: right-handed parallel beta-helix repeat-containing protein [Rhizomicrobium sp.]